MRGLSDEDFIPGNSKKRGRPRKRNSDDDSSSATEEELFDDVEEEESLHWSSASSDVGVESEGSEEYIPKGRNAKRVAERKSKCSFMDCFKLLSCSAHK